MLENIAHFPSEVNSLYRTAGCIQGSWRYRTDRPLLTSIRFRQCRSAASLPCVDRCPLGVLTSLRFGCSSPSLQTAATAYSRSQSRSPTLERVINYETSLLFPTPCSEMCWAIRRIKSSGNNHLFECAQHALEGTRFGSLNCPAVGVPGRAGGRPRFIHPPYLSAAPHHIISPLNNPCK